MLQIVVWGLSAILAALSTLPLFIRRSEGTASKVAAVAVLVSGLGTSAFLVHAAAEQAAPVTSYSDPLPIDPNNPFFSR